MHIKLEITDIGSEFEYERSEDIKCSIDELVNDKLSDEMILWKKVCEFRNIYCDELTETEVKGIKRFMNILKFYGDFTEEDVYEAEKK